MKVLISKISLAVAVSSMLFMSASVWADAVDSTQIKPLNSGNMTMMKYTTEVDTSNCVNTAATRFVVAGGTGGGKLDQQCPADFPVMYRWSQTVGYSTAVPWFGALMAGGGANSITCCAVKHVWA